ncbi:MULTISPECIES: thioredoxin family protein [Haloferax]|uniref:Thioredoxin n=1 Tax=Haloferax marinum TaxID=2666143 RepID=A0A6A8G6Y1_9EURY|nr:MULTISPECIES: thioredoxin family protein [Haloferax]KAB1196871.1 thioredoxin family protein [Haloferax sp. CBA1150]MRW95886.1 thioredoxin [Haloferax marinum]
MAATNPNHHADPETALDTLIAAGAVEEAPDGTLTTTDEFEKTLAIYHDIYGAVSNEEFENTVAELFGLDSETANERIEKFDIGREDVVAYLATQSFLDIPVEQDLLVVMAGLLVEITPSSSVPEELTELADDTFEAFLEENPDAVITVWRRNCAPCDAMKEELDALLERVPDGVAIAGVDGEEVGEFCRTFDVDAAPSILCFRAGDLKEHESGRRSPDEVSDIFGRVY